MEPERAEKLAELMRARIAQLEARAGDMDRAMKNLPRVGLLFSVVVPIGAVYGLFAAFFAALCVGSLIGVAAYLMGTRRAWYRSEAALLAREIADLHAGARAGG